MLRYCVEPPTVQDTFWQTSGLISYVGITLEVRTAVFMWQYFPSSPEIGKWLLVSCLETSKGGKRSSRWVNWFVYKLTNSMHGMPFVSDWGKSDTSMVYEEIWFNQPCLCPSHVHTSDVIHSNTNCAWGQVHVLHRAYCLCVEWGSTNTGWHIDVYHVKTLHTHEVWS